MRHHTTRAHTLLLVAAKFWFVGISWFQFRITLRVWKYVMALTWDHDTMRAHTLLLVAASVQYWFVGNQHLPSFAKSCCNEDMMALMRGIIGGWEHRQCFLFLQLEFWCWKLVIAVVKCVSMYWRFWWHSHEASWYDKSTYNASCHSYSLVLICQESTAAFTCKLWCNEDMMALMRGIIGRWEHRQCFSFSQL